MKYLFGILLFFVYTSPIFAHFQVSTLDYKVHEGKIITFSDNTIEFLTLENKLIKIASNNVIKIENVLIKEEPVKKNRVCVKLTSGSSLYGEITDGSPQFVGIQTEMLGFFSIDLTQIRQILFVESLQIESNSSENDVLYFKSGDIMKGLIEEFGNGYVQIDHAQLGSRREQFIDLKAISFALLEPLLNNSKETNLATIIGGDNSKLIGTIININQNTLRLQLKENNSIIEIVTTKIKHILFNNDRFTYLSDMSHKTKNIPYFHGNSNPNPVQLDKNYAGNPLVLKGEMFFKGIGTISKTQILFDLKQEYTKLNCYLGIDDQIADLYRTQSNILGGSVVFRVYLDSRKIFESDIVYHFSELIHLSVDVSKGKELVLEVDFGDNAHVNDFANWADAILVR